MPRLFVALELPRPTRDTLRHALPAIAGGRPVKPEHMHLTLRFVGEVDADTTRQLRELLSAVTGSPHELGFTKPGTFPPLGTHRPPSVLYLGLARRPELLSLQGEVDQAVEACGQPREARAFVPHVTLARLKNSPLSQVQRALGALESLTLPAFAVGEFVLFESTLDAAGPTYLELGRYPLSTASRR